jgi:hypothetical protein
VPGLFGDLASKGTNANRRVGSRALASRRLGRGRITLRKPRKTRFALEVEAVEPRRLPSGLTPVLTTQTYQAVVAAVEEVTTNLARTHDLGRAAASLAHLSARVPFGVRQLAPTWINTLAGYNPQVPDSAIATEQHLLADLKGDVVAGVDAGEFRLTGPGAAAILGSVRAPQVSLDSVTIVNQTGRNITVTAFLNNTQRTLTKTIANGGSPLFDFGTSTGNPISLSVRRADGGQPPAPANFLLGRPVTGYNGKRFTVGVFAGFFTITA